jgi:hypothetical protein
MLEDIYNEWQVKFLPDKNLHFYMDEVDKKQCLYTATRISMVAKRIVI